MLLSQFSSVLCEESESKESEEPDYGEEEELEEGQEKDTGEFEEEEKTTNGVF